jgi:hypothetical protein
MKILLTGGNGNVAKYLNQSLSEIGYKIDSLSSKGKVPAEYFNLKYGYDDAIFKDVSSVIHCAVNPDLIFNDIEKDFLDRVISMDIKLFYVGSTSSYLVERNNYGNYKKEVESYVEQIGGLVLTCGLLYGDNFNGQVSLLEKLLTKLPFKISLSGSKFVYLTRISSLSTIIHEILYKNLEIKGRILLSDWSQMSFNAFLSKLSGNKKLTISFSSKLLVILLKLFPIRLTYFGVDRLKGLLSEFKPELVEEARSSKII